MARIVRGLFAFCVLLLGAGLAVVASGPTTLEGRWRLSEQYYGEGRHDFQGPGDRLEVVFRTRGAALTGRLLWADDLQAEWPAYPAPGGAARLDRVRSTVAPDLRSATASYRVLPAPGDDTYLLVDEQWTLAGDDRLECRVTLRFERRGRVRGGFAWHRVFVREAGR
ncbi:MAG: hypothetical protein Q9Q40_07775 [Acidobacteriota bacterium]|nr:hypothetical protein [Acidobacteriota bacterium]MDQ7087277.1 hypothetical protein [Acidobacteriota bacterium]